MTVLYVARLRLERLHTTIEWPVFSELGYVELINAIEDGELGSVTILDMLPRQAARAAA